ncbi:alginate lyase family protein [Hymenobacter terrigena]
MTHYFKLGLVCAALLLPGLGASAQSSRSPFILLDAAQMAAYKAAYAKGSPAEVKQVKAVVSEADHALTAGPYTITTKPQVPPSGDKHDYISQAPYWWADPTKPDGKPYIQKDGLRNPESANMKDSDNLSNLCKDTKTLGLAYYFTGNEKYADHAAALLRTFFLDANTRMNPNLNYGQGIPGTTNGRSFGIIETRNLVEIPDALALMAGSKSLNEPVVNGVKAWFKQFNTWLTTSKIGIEEGNNKNNHGTFHDVQVVDFALFTGDVALAKKVLKDQTLPRVPVQLAPDGAQPLELARTRPWNYTSMNLQGWVRLAQLAKKVDVDLWHYATPDGRSLQKAVAWFRPYLLHEKQMEKKELTPSSNTTVLAIYGLAAREYPALDAPKVFAQYPDFARTPWGI